MNIQKPTMIIFTIFFLIQCSNQMTVNHPPSYSDILKTESLIVDNFDNCEYANLSAQIQFSPKDLCRIYNDRNPTFLLASAIITDSMWLWWRNLSAIKIEKLSAKEKCLYYQHIIVNELFRYSIDLEKFDLSYYLNVVDQLISMDSENAYPYYLKSVLLYSCLHDVNSAMEQIILGNKKSRYDDYSKTKYTLIRDTALFLGYSPFAARYYAHMNTEPSPFIVPSKITDICKEAIKTNDSSACSEAGFKIERKGLYAQDQLFGLFIQCGCKCNTDSRFKDHYGLIRKKWKRILNLRLHHEIFQENRYIELIEDIYNRGEIIAYDNYYEN